MADSLYGSDHYPIVIPIITNDTKNTRRPRWIIAKADWELFQNSLNFTVINKNLEFIATNIINAAETAIPRTSDKLPKKNGTMVNEIKTLLLKQI